MKLHRERPDIALLHPTPPAKESSLHIWKFILVDNVHNTVYRVFYTFLTQ